MLKIEGPCRLEGETCVQGAKNSTLPLLASSVLCRGISVFHHCPRLLDVETSIEILEHLGCRVCWEGETLTVDSTDVTHWDIPDHLMRKMRSSIVFLGAILSRMGQASLSYPGGCELGPRPIDLHLDAMRKMGVQIREAHGRIDCNVRRGLRGTVLHLSFPSVGATENSLLTAVMADGITTIHNAAREPEIQDLSDYLNDCGADIRGAGESTIIVKGVKSLRGCAHTIIPDRIVASTLLSAAAITGGTVQLRRVEPNHLQPVLHVLEEAGCHLTLGKHEVALTAPPRLNAVQTVRTMPYPGFPTDAQSPMMAMLLKSNGTTLFEENIFESRFKHVDELIRLGGDIQVVGRAAVVKGVEKLYGARVVAPDLRGGAALVIGGLASEGTTEVLGVDYLDRGYEHLETVLSSLGANIQRVENDDAQNQQKTG
ncbi:MAG: UDP-N-acetylglucosamine 1-carboxyvinyltransferase [Oscillospiraceae bacterium]|nr:UDP-N-acetylglucosamine 1-carboxyvinyltransferase [Oscillospiraceae bacterium]